MPDPPTPSISSTHFYATKMACVRNCCCCVNLRVGGVLMGIMTLALSVFSIVPMAISLANRVYLSRVMTHVVSRYNEEKAANNGPSVSFWGAVSKVWSPDAVDLPSETMDEVQMLAEAMLVFFIVAIILLVRMKSLAFFFFS